MAALLGCSISADGKQATLSPSGAGTVVFCLESSMKGKREWEFGFCWSWSFLPFSCVSSTIIPFPLWCGLCALALHLGGFGICVIPELQLSGNYSERTDLKRGREGERLCEYNHSRKQIPHDNIFCLFQIGLELFYSSEMPEDKWGLIEMWSLDIYKQARCVGQWGHTLPAYSLHHNLSFHTSVIKWAAKRWGSIG